ncbi:hypothetical protein [Pseudomonas mosselii]|uniref:Uncharacterized protein n=1 Tax=Pseudomonas mosselii TaxID=78327 RepID=A0A7W2PYJ9_9PSED|nr:hypothetical protein [Pseudomonas mosselii]MBA6065540.1 hypothetical protein [Pseudomonas mosselii]
MNIDKKNEALTAWRHVLDSPEIRMAAADQYEELVRLADNYQRGGLISEEERNALIFEATNRYACLVTGNRECSQLDDVSIEHANRQT